MRRSLPLVLALVLAAGACVPRVSPPAVDPPRRVQLTTSDITAIAALLRMEDERALDSARAAALIRHPEPEVRSRAALALGRVGDVRARALLLDALADSVAPVRASAVFALGELGDTAAPVSQRLAEALGGRDSAALEAPAALAKLGTPAGLQALLALLQAEGAAAPASPLLREVLLALWRFNPRPGAAAAALAHTTHVDPEVRWAAVYNFARSAPPASAVRPLLERLADADALVRATAARALRPAPVDSAGLTGEARTALQRALADEHPHVRINAARALAAFRNPADAAAVARLTSDADVNVRIAAAEALASLAAAAGTLHGLATDASAPLALRFAALSSLARSDTARALAIASSWTAAQEWLQRLYGTRVLSGLPWSLTAEPLQRAARDPDPRVQAEAFGALASADSSATIAAMLLEGLASPDPLVRAAAARGLGRRADPAYLSALLQAYDRAQRDPINDAALAAVDALRQLAQRAVPVAHSFFLRFPPARDPIVRARVAQHFGTATGSWGPALPVRTGRDAAFYERVVAELVAPPLAGAPAPRVRIHTEKGDIVLELAAAEAPLTVHNFLSLIRSGFYRVPGLRWHRVVPNFVLQDGDPRGDGSGGPAHVIRDEINPLRYRRGVLGMALSGPDTGGSQYFITHSPQPHLDGGYTIFGRVVEGMDVADAIVQDDAILAIEVVQ